MGGSVDSDTLLVLGMLIAALAIPSAISAFSGARAPRGAAIAIMLGGGLILLAVLTKPGGYAPSQIPAVFTRVFAGILN